MEELVVAVLGRQVKSSCESFMVTPDIAHLIEITVTESISEKGAPSPCNSHGTGQHPFPQLLDLKKKKDIFATLEQFPS